MEFEGDIVYDSSMESTHNDSGDDYDYDYDCDGDYSNYDSNNNNYDDDDATACRHPERSYTVLKEADIRQRQEDDITKLCTILPVSRVTASVLLCHYNWSVSKVHEEWFSDEDKVRESFGLLDKAVTDVNASCSSSRDGMLTCRICYESCPFNLFTSVVCGHLFCIACWYTYISNSIDDGPECLRLRCPEVDCRVVVDQEKINSMVSNEHKEKYVQYLLRSYVEGSRNIKWCPAPGCECAVEFVFGSESYDVLCDCSNGFCWNCKEEAHRPVNCEIVSKWMLKNSSEADNVNWILVHTKACPKCKNPIEKNLGCMHMTCKCKYEFCWLCLGPWKQHNEQTGGFFACNKYEKGRREGVYSEEERKRDMAKSVLERYTHYYERWSGNEDSRKKALKDLNDMQTVYVEKLTDFYSTTESQLKCIMDAWNQIIEGRRVLKWTYAYGYYFPEKEDAKRHLFEDLQCQAESALEKLHQCAEEELRPFLSYRPPEEFHNFCVKLTAKTTATKHFFENLVRALENDLADMNSHVACS